MTPWLSLFLIILSLLSIGAILFFVRKNIVQRTPHDDHHEHPSPRAFPFSACAPVVPDEHSIDARVHHAGEYEIAEPIIPFCHRLRIWLSGRWHTWTGGGMVHAIVAMVVFSIILGLLPFLVK